MARRRFPEGELVAGAPAVARCGVEWSGGLLGRTAPRSVGDWGALCRKPARGCGALAAKRQEAAVGGRVRRGEDQAAERRSAEARDSARPDWRDGSCCRGNQALRREATARPVGGRGSPARR
ncbi:hypothetical protein GCM10022380_37110 [Amycolatopsis tucumanensis]|uniref:Uncharacterized protein n=1 Tax=Amycolatopsis tucumanensis TaxID=401106 RepID=A0ABP7ID93_9PSEU